MKFALVRMVENPATYRYFNGYSMENKGRFLAMDDSGVCTIEPVSDWEPTDGHGRLLEWPPAPIGHRVPPGQMQVLPEGEAEEAWPDKGRVVGPLAPYLRKPEGAPPHCSECLSQDVTNANCRQCGAEFSQEDS